MTAPNPPAWQVVDQTPSTGPGPGGTFTTGVDITYVLATGKTGVVFVPAAAYTVEKARAIIAAHAETAAAILDLNG